jgi:tetratricopeptide (TPR) repeat protein
MFTPLVVRSGFMTEYGLGWGVRPLNGHFAVNHSGSQPETRTQILLFPAEAFAVAIACNLEGANLLPYVRRLVDLVLEEESGLYAYAPDRVRQSIYEAVSYAFDYGLGYFLWTGSPLSKDRGDLENAFDYFLESTGQSSLGKDYDKAKKKILAGIHPSAGQALTKVGSYMAWALEEESGTGSLQAYHRRGPIAFFNDYIRLSAAAASPKRHPRLNGEFSRLMAEWERDWAKTHTEEIQRLVITPGADFEALIPKLKEAFAGASICPDITSDLAGAADYFLKRNDGERAVSVLALGREAYPASPSLAAALGYALIWSGRAEEGQKLYLEARELDPAHPGLKADPFIASMKQLVRIDKKKEALDLGLIAVAVNPKEPILYISLGDLSMLSGRRDKAAEYFREALRIDPDFEDAKTRLKSLEK